VYHLAREIAEGVEHDEEVLHAACFLHDIEMSVGHPKSSADRAEAILHETGFEPEKIPLVVDAIVNHMPTGNPATVEGKLLFDANLLDSIGAVMAILWPGEEASIPLARASGRASMRLG
jgi:uncharacterized protein